MVGHQGPESVYIKVDAPCLALPVSLIAQAAIRKWAAPVTSPL